MSELHREDLALAQACSRGNAAAWERFTALYGRRIFAMAINLSRDETVARELADSIYGDLFESKLATYSGRGPLEGWLKAVLSQAYIDRYRSRRRVVSLDEGLAVMQPALFNAPPSQVDPRLMPAIRTAFLALPAEERYLLTSYFFDQRTLAELARTLGIHESTVSRRLSRLIRRLRSRIARLLREQGMSPRQVEESFLTDVRDLSLDLQ
jgi:RNA polymerase sigma-70 factor (ECF subfamily)